MGQSNALLGNMCVKLFSGRRQRDTVVEFKEQIHVASQIIYAESRQRSAFSNDDLDERMSVEEGAINRESIGVNVCNSLELQRRHGQHGTAINVVVIGLRRVCISCIVVIEDDLGDTRQRCSLQVCGGVHKQRDIRTVNRGTFVRNDETISHICFGLGSSKVDSCTACACIDVEQ